MLLAPMIFFLCRVDYALEENVLTEQMWFLPLTLFFIYKNVVFPAQAEYSYFSADFRLKIFLYYS